MLPDCDGFDPAGACAKTYAALGRIPVVFLTARSDEVDRVLGLEIGGDDYITKPFSPRELIARVKAHLRRAASRSDGGGSPPPSCCGWGRSRSPTARRTG